MTARSCREEDLARIGAALATAARAAGALIGRSPQVEYKADGDPVTDVEKRIDEVLRGELLRDGEGWLSEETADDLSRLEKNRVWVVDPIDGTREFIEGLPEWSISVGLVERGIPTAGGILNPSTDWLVLGSLETGVTVNGIPCCLSEKTSLSGCLVLASRTEMRRGEWTRFEDRGYEIRPSGSIALKLGLVAAELADATWTLMPKHEWDVAAGVALVRAAGGDVCSLLDELPPFNRRTPLLPGLIAHRPGLLRAISLEMARSRRARTAGSTP